MAKTLINLDRQATAKVFPFGDTSAGNEALVTIHNGTAATSAVVLDVKGSQNIAGNLNLSGDLNIPFTAARLLGSGVGTKVTEITLGTGLSFTGNTLNASSSGGTVTTISIATANGFAGTILNPTTAPVLTISTSVTGILYGNGTGISAAVAGNFPTLNQNTSGSAATLLTSRTMGMTGDVVWTSAAFNGSSNVTGTSTIQNNAVTLAKMAQVGTGTIFYRKTAGTGSPELQSLATLKTDLGISGTNSGDQIITLTGDVTGSGSASFAVSLAVYNKVTTVTGLQNEVNKIFTIGNSFKSNSEQIYLNGQLLTPGSGNDYILSGTTLTFQSAMPAPFASDVIKAYGVY